MLDSERHQQAARSSEKSSSERAREKSISPEPGQVEANIQDDEAQTDHQKPRDVLALTPTEP
jgi:hypothetical protein